MGAMKPKATCLCKICGKHFTQSSVIQAEFKSSMTATGYVVPCPSCTDKCYDDLRLREARGELTIITAPVRHLDKKALLVDFITLGEKK